MNPLYQNLVNKGGTIFNTQTGAGYKDPAALAGYLGSGATANNINWSGIKQDNNWSFQSPTQNATQPTSGSIFNVNPTAGQQTSWNLPGANSPSTSNSTTQFSNQSAAAYQFPQATASNPFPAIPNQPMLAGGKAEQFYNSNTLAAPIHGTATPQSLAAARLPQTPTTPATTGAASMSQGNTQPLAGAAGFSNDQQQYANAGGQTPFAQSNGAGNSSSGNNGGMGGNPQMDFMSQYLNNQQNFFKQSQATVDRLQGLYDAAAKANTPPAELTALQNQIQQQQLTLANSTPQQYFKDNPNLKDVGITQGQLERTTAQENLPIEQGLAAMMVARSASLNTFQQGQQAANAQVTAGQNQLSLENQRYQQGAYGGLPPELAGQFLSKMMFPQWSSYTDAYGQPGVFNQYNPQQNMQLGPSLFGGQNPAGKFGGAAQGQAMNNPSQGIVNGYNLASYATDPQYGAKVTNALQQLPQFQSAQDISSYIQQVAPGSPVTGQMIAQAAQQYGVDPNQLVAQMHVESQFGTQGAGVKTFNPGNVGNTDGGRTTNMGSWQDGVNAMAQNLAGRKVQGQQSNQQIGTQPSEQQVLQDQQQGIFNLGSGIRYFDPTQFQDNAGLKLRATENARAQGIPILTDATQVGAVKTIAEARGQLTMLNKMSQDLLGSGLMGRIQGWTTNQFAQWTQANPEWRQFQAMRAGLIKSVQGIAAGAPGLRVTGAELSNAAEALPNSTDNLESAQVAINTFGKLLDTNLKTIFPTYQPPSQSGGGSDAGLSDQAAYQAYLKATGA